MMEASKDEETKFISEDSESELDWSLLTEFPNQTNRGDQEKDENMNITLSDGDVIPCTPQVKSKRARKMSKNAKDFQEFRNGKDF